MCSDRPLRAGWLCKAAVGFSSPPGARHPVSAAPLERAFGAGGTGSSGAGAFSSGRDLPSPSGPSSPPGAGFQSRCGWRGGCVLAEPFGQTEVVRVVGG